jgi:hypothetical protein
MYINTCLCKQIYVCVYIYVDMYMCTYIYIYMYMFKWVYTHYIYTHKSTYLDPQRTKPRQKWGAKTCVCGSWCEVQAKIIYTSRGPGVDGNDDGSSESAAKQNRQMSISDR